MKYFKYLLFMFFFSITLNSFSLELFVNDKNISTDEYQALPEIINDRTYVPLRFVSDALGYNVDWDGVNKQVLINNSSDPMSAVQPENPEKNLRIVLNGKPMFFPADCGQPFINKNNITMVPIRGVSEAMKFQVSFSNNTVYIKGNTQPDYQVIPVSEVKEELVPPQKDPYFFDLTILGNSVATKEQLVSYTRDRERSYRKSVPEMYGRPYIEIPDLIDYYLEIGEEYGIQGDIAYLQAIKETNFFQFTGLVQPHQNNYSGIWATGAALKGDESFNGVSPLKFEAWITRSQVLKKEIKTIAGFKVELYIYKRPAFTNIENDQNEGHIFDKGKNRAILFGVRLKKKINPSLQKILKAFSVALSLQITDLDSHMLIPIMVR